MLYQLKIDELKLDRGFLSKTSGIDNSRRKIILKQIIQFAKKLGIISVAEGIETSQDIDVMLNLSCEYGQGYYFDKPLDATLFDNKYMNNKN